MSSSTSSSERAAPVLARTLCWAVLTGAVLLALTEALLRGPVTDADPFATHSRFYERANSANAAFGDSHVARGFLGTTEMPNLAYLSESVAQTDLKVRTYFARRAPGRVLLLGAPHQFSAARMSGADSRDYGSIFGLGEDPYEWLRLADPYHRPRIGRYFVTWLKGGFALQPAYVFGANGALLSDAAVQRPSPSHELSAAERVASLSPGVGFERSEAAVTFARLLDYLTAQGAELCVVTFPVTSSYRKYADRDPRFAEARGFVERTATRARARYVSYWSRLDDLSLFADSDHLNRSGAAWLTPRIMGDCFGDRRLATHGG